MSAQDVTPKSGPGSLNLGLLGLSDKLSERTKKLLIAYAIGETAIRFAKARFDRARSELRYSVAVSADDPLYRDLHSWLLDAMPPVRRRALNVRSVSLINGKPTDGPISSTDHLEPGLALYYDADRVQKVNIGGYRILVALERATFEMAMLARDDDRSFRRADRLILTAPNEAARDAVVELLTELRRQQDKRVPRLNIATAWGEWSWGKELSGRPLSTVVLRHGQQEAIVADLKRFLASEQDCIRLGIPWHRGYLLKGDPGSGKSSLAKALASHLGLDVFYLNLSAVQDDNRLAQLLGVLQPRSVLMLEGIDVVHGSRERDDKSEGVTLAGLLNSLDGFLTPHGLITFMTSNHASVLDPALVRPGRVDFTLELGPLDDDQLGRLVAAFLGDGPLPKMRQPVLPAEVVGVLKDHLDDPASARAAVAELVMA